jgi:hypothetical protein
MAATLHALTTLWNATRSCERINAIIRPLNHRSLSVREAGRMRAAHPRSVIMFAAFFAILSIDPPVLRGGRLQWR